MAYIINFAEVGIRVNDLEKMATFYQETVGFELHITMPNVIFLKVGDLKSPLGDVNHPQILALFKREAEANAKYSTLDHLAFEVAPEDYDTEYQRYEDKNMIIRERTWPDSLPWRGRSFFFHDPEGNVVEIIAASGK